MRSTTETLIAAMRVLARDIQSDDSVANAAIAEAADRLEECSTRIAELEARAGQFQLIGFTTPSYAEEWLATRDPAHLLLMAYHGNHRVAVFTLKNGAELAKRGESPQFEGTMVEPQVGDVIRRPHMPTLPVAVDDGSGQLSARIAELEVQLRDANGCIKRAGGPCRRQALAESILRRYPLAWEEYCNRAAAPAPEAQVERHEWDRDGERCAKCGDKDWFASAACSGRKQAPHQTGEDECK